MVGMAGLTEGFDQESRIYNHTRVRASPPSPVCASTCQIKQEPSTSLKPAGTPKISLVTRDSVGAGCGALHVDDLPYLPPNPRYSLLNLLELDDTQTYGKAKSRV